MGGGARRGAAHVVIWCHQRCRSSVDVLSPRRKKKKASSFVIIFFLFIICLKSFDSFFFFVNDNKKWPAFKCSGRFQSHLNRFLKTSVGDLVLPFLPFETADFLENL